MIVHLSKNESTGVIVDEVIETSDYTNVQIEEIAKYAIENEV